MRIVHIITTLDAGGAEKQLLILIKSQVAHGNSTFVIYLKGEGELRASFEDLGCRVMKFRSISHFFFLIRRTLKQINPEIIHAHLPRAEVASLLSHRNVPFLVSRHNAEPFWPKSVMGLSSFLSRIITARSSGVIAISNGVRDFILRNNEISQKTLVEVIHYGYDARIPTLPPRKRNKGLPYRFLCVSRLAVQKDIPTLLLAFSEHRAQNPSSHLTIVGDGSLRAELLNYASQLSLGDSITWIGRTLDISKYFLESDCLVLPSRYEGFGLVLLEAMQYGMPILASNHEVILEVLGRDYPALFEIGDFHRLAILMNELIDPSLSHFLAQLTSQRLDFFNPEKNYQLIQKAYLAGLAYKR